MIRKPALKWLSEDVEIAFNLERVNNFPILMEWLDVPKNTILSPPMEKLRLSLSKNVQYWNEGELEVLFIAPFFSEFGFNNAPFYRIFMQRQLTNQAEGEESQEVNKIKCFIATGKQTPKKPFFFLQEYKPEKNSGNDPLGQLLIAMVDAQILNQTPEKPLFGCYMIGRFWFFIILENKNYSLSKAYDATQTDDLSEIIEILEKVKYIYSQGFGAACACEE